MRGATALGALCLGVLIASAPERALASEWEQISDDDGIAVWQRSVEGSSVVEFRGRGLVTASFSQILAVLSDSTRKTEWMDRCAEARKVRLFDPGRQVLYQRIGSNIPLVDDRDVVMKSELTIEAEKKRIVVTVEDVEDPLEPPREGVVRMPELAARWTLEVVGPETTRVTYQVRADPGGAIPKWVVNLVSKSMPAKTIQRLRAQVKKPGYEDLRARVLRSFDWSGFEST